MNLRLNLYSSSKYLLIFLSLFIISCDTWTPLPTILDNGVSNLYQDPNDPGRVWGTPYGMGLWHSDDGGANWTSATETEDALYYSSIEDISFNSSDVNTIIVATLGKLSKTTNRGLTWTQLPAAGLPDTRIFDIQAHPVNDDLFYVLSSSKGVFKTVDGGNTFVDINSAAFVSQMQAAYQLSIHPAQHDTLILASLSGGVYKSINAGDSWSEISGGSGLGTIKAHARYDLSNFDPTPFVAGSSEFFRLYVSGYSSIGGSKEQFLCYNDTLNQNGWTCPTLGGGFNLWSQVGKSLTFSPDLDHSFTTLVNERDYYFRLMKFTASSGSLTGTVGPIVSRRANSALYFQNSNTILVGTFSNIQRSTDGGATVENFSTLPGSNSWITLNPGKRNQIQRSKDFTNNEGRSWRPYSGVDFNTYEQGFSSIAFSATDSSICYAIASNFNYGAETAGFFKSSNRCKDFDYVSSINTNGNWVPTMVVDPTNDQVIYIGTLRKGIFKSTDGGVTWTQKINGFPTTNIWAEQLIIDPDMPSTLYAALVRYGSSKGIYKTVDGGENWFAIHNGIEADDINKFWSRVGSVTMDPANSNRLCAIPGGDTSSEAETVNLYCTNNGGNNWNIIANNLPIVNWYLELTIDPLDSNKMWVMLRDDDLGSMGIYFSANGGLNWTPFNNGIDRSGYFPEMFYSFKINVLNPSKLYISVLGRSIYKYIRSGL